MWLAPGVSDDAKEKAQQEVDKLKQEMESFGPELEASQKRIVETEQATQASKHRLDEKRKSLDLLRKLDVKIKNAERKLLDAEKELEKDDEEEKQRLVSMLKNRIASSISALETHAESQRLLMETTYKLAGVRLDKDMVATEERRAK